MRTFFKQTDDEILPVDYTCKVVDKGLKIKRIMWHLERLAG